MSRVEVLSGFLAHGWADSPSRIAVAVAVTVAFALLARTLRAVSLSGVVAGTVSCLALFAGGGPAAFAVLSSLFAMTWASTRRGAARKQELGVAERKDGRNGWQVLANLGVSAAGSLLFAQTGNRMWIVVMVAALAEAATDTVASEIGQTGSRTAFLITNWKRVPAGTDGGISGLGTGAGISAGIVVATMGRLTGLLTPPETWIPVMAGFVGMLVDSVLGATVQRRGWLGNEAVNLWGTLVAAGIAYAVAS